MRAEEFLNEIERISKSGYEGGKEAMKFDYGREKTVRPLPGGSGLLYSITDGGGDYEIKIWDPRVKEFDPGEPPKRMSWQLSAEYNRMIANWKERNEMRKREFARSPGLLVGKLDVEAVGNYFPIKGAVQVNTITVDEDYRGGGIGKALYGIVLTIMKRPLVAGSSQTPGGRKNWASLSQIPGVELKGYVAIDDYDLDTDVSSKQASKRAEQTIDTIMGQLGGQYIGRTNHGIEYFAFDVQPNTTGNELQAYVDTKLTKVYSNDYRGRGDNGLFAIWTGK